MNQEYVISFSSFYKAAYAQDMLEEAGIASTLKKLPTELGPFLQHRTVSSDG